MDKPPLYDLLRSLSALVFTLQERDTHLVRHFDRHDTLIELLEAMVERHDAQLAHQEARLAAHEAHLEALRAVQRTDLRIHATISRTLGRLDALLAEVVRARPPRPDG